MLALGLTEEKQHVLRYVEAGATGYVLKDDSLEDMIETVRAAQDGRVFVSPQIAAALMERLADLAHMFSGIENSVSDTAGLTSRELEVLQLIGEGLTNQMIAEQLVIEVGTVKNHVHNILDKLNLNSRGEAAAYIRLYQKINLPAVRQRAGQHVSEFVSTAYDHAHGILLRMMLCFS